MFPLTPTTAIRPARFGYTAAGPSQAPTSGAQWGTQGTVMEVQGDTHQQGRGRRVRNALIGAAGAGFLLLAHQKNWLARLVEATPLKRVLSGYVHQRLHAGQEPVVALRELLEHELDPFRRSIQEALDDLYRAHSFHAEWGADPAAAERARRQLQHEVTSREETLIDLNRVADRDKRETEQSRLKVELEDLQNKLEDYNIYLGNRDHGGVYLGYRQAREAIEQNLKKLQEHCKVQHKAASRELAEKKEALEKVNQLTSGQHTVAAQQQSQAASAELETARDKLILIDRFIQENGTLKAQIEQHTSPLKSRMETMKGSIDDICSRIGFLEQFQAEAAELAGA
ncbi:MAG: hypothetical protein AB7P76_01945 [Candidatus Melainabacteria bacterium]